MLRIEKKAEGGGTFLSTWLTFPLSHLNVNWVLTLEQTAHRSPTFNKAYF